MDGRSQIKVHTNERTQVHSAQSFLVVTHPGTNRARRLLTSVTESPSKHIGRHCGPRFYTTVICINIGSQQDKEIYWITLLLLTKI